MRFTREAIRRINDRMQHPEKYPVDPRVSAAVAKAVDKLPSPKRLGQILNEVYRKFIRSESEETK